MGAIPAVPLDRLDVLWIQVAGTLCNLECAHCLVTSGPGIDRHRMMPAQEVIALVDRAARLGVREVYFTGGEPFLHPEIERLCAHTLERLPLTVLTNGMLLPEARAARLGALFARSRLSFEIRVSLDGIDAASNDRIRGAGNFDAAVEGIRRLVRHGMAPIVTTVAPPGGTSPESRAAILDLLERLAIPKPRLKLLPLFPVGRESGRSGLVAIERLQEGDLDREALARLPCASSRIVTSEGVFACPIRIDDAAARLGSDLDQACGSVPLSSAACFVCHATGATCAT
jgi:MoaA/NifB/PqqE/SkfB family radical SAM enzyme